MKKLGAIFSTLVLSAQLFAQIETDVLVVGGTVKGVSAAVAAKKAGAETFLVTGYTYLGDDMAGTLELGYETQASSKTPLVRKLRSSEMPLAQYDYWPEKRSPHPRWIYHNDWWERISESGRPPSPSDSVFYTSDISYNCKLRKPSHISKIEVIVLETTTFATEGVAAIEEKKKSVEHGKKVAQTESVSCIVKGGELNGKVINFTRKGKAFNIAGDYYRGNAEAISYVAEINNELNEVDVTIKKIPSADHQLISRIWFHLSSADAANALPSPLKVKRVLDKELLDNSINFLTASPVCDLIKDDAGNLKGVVVATRSGKKEIRAKKVIDATVNSLLSSFGKGMNVKNKKAKFSRVVMSAGAPPQAPEMKVEEVASGYKISHIQNPSEGKLYRCSFEFDLKDGLYPSFAAAEWKARELTWVSGMMDDADSLVWAERPLLPLEERIAEGEKLGSAAAGSAKNMKSDSSATPANIPLEDWGEWDVVVVGGGTSGSPAALAAGRSGAKTLVVEYLNVLGGVGTDGMILGYYDGNHCGFTTEFKLANKKVGARFGLYPRAETWRRMCNDANVQVFLGAFGYEAIVDKGKVTGVKIATPYGCGKVRAKCVIDGTGNSDIAASAGAKTVFLPKREFALQSAGQAPHRLGRNGINSDFGFVNDSDVFDLWLFGVRARAGAPQNAWDIAKMPDSRERRRIIADIQLSGYDIAAKRKFPDTLVQAQSRQDSHGYLIDDFAFVSESTAIMVPSKKEMRAQLQANVPLRSLLPTGISGIAVVGLGLGCERDVTGIVRMQADLMNMGYSAGVAAAMASKNGGDFRKIDIPELRKKLVEKKILRPEVLTWINDEDISSDELIETSVDLMRNGFKGSHVVMRPENRLKALPFLRKAYKEATASDEKQIYAMTLGLLGDATGVETLLAVVSGKEKLKVVRPQGAYGGRGNVLTGMMIALGRTKDERALEPFLKKLSKVNKRTSINELRQITLSLEALASPKAANAIAQCLKQDGMHGFAVSDMRVLPPQGGYGLDSEADNCIRELALARALIACGDYEGLAKKTFESYAKDPRGFLSAHAKNFLR
jgi:hypothetical protein